MYSPKIAPDLIPKIYRVAKERRLSMTKLVDLILRERLEKPFKRKVGERQ